MKYITRERIFNFIIVAISKVLYIILKLNIHKKYESYYFDKSNSLIKNAYMPVLSYSPINGTYRFNCYCFDCPCNQDGLCMSEFTKIPHHLMHEFDGDNCIKNFCG